MQAIDYAYVVGSLMYMCASLVTAIVQARHAINADVDTRMELEFILITTISFTGTLLCLPTVFSNKASNRERVVFHSSSFFTNLTLIFAIMSVRYTLSYYRMLLVPAVITFVLVNTFCGIRWTQILTRKKV